VIGLGNDFNAESKVIESTVGKEYQQAKVKYWKKEFSKRFGKRKSKVQEIRKKLKLKLNKLELKGENINRYMRVIRKLEKRNGLN
jgi:hypothetical protein